MGSNVWFCLGGIKCLISFRWDQMSWDHMSWDQKSRDQKSRDQKSRDQKSWDQTSGIKWKWDQMSGIKCLGSDVWDQMSWSRKKWKVATLNNLCLDCLYIMIPGWLFTTHSCSSDGGGDRGLDQCETRLRSTWLIVNDYIRLEQGRGRITGCIPCLYYDTSNDEWGTRDWLAG